MAEITEIKRKQPTSATELELMLGSDNLIPIKDIEDVGLRGYAVRRLAAGVISERHRNDLIELASILLRHILASENNSFIASTSDAALDSMLHHVSKGI